MSKRRLTRRQAWRIEKVQQERARRAEHRGAHSETLLEAGELGPEQTGRVIAHYGAQVDVTTGPGAPTVRCHLRTLLGDLVTGDAVVWRAGTSTGVVVARQPRTSVLSRPDSSGKLRPIASNVDQIVVVLATRPQAHALLLDRYLVAALHSDIPATLFLNKVDMLDALQDGERTDLENLLASYIGIGYRVLRGSSKTDEGLEPLRGALRDRTSVFIGQSGVGKSSLVNALLPGITQRTGALSGALHGVHTTTTAQLFDLPEGGALIDSPGVREFGLWHMSAQEVAQGFVDFAPYLGRCRFRNCAHAGDPGCALEAAIAAGALQAARLESYRHIISASA